MSSRIYVSSFAFFSLAWICGVFCSERGFCYNGYSWLSGKCYGLISDPLLVDDAESECNKLHGGHLAVFHTHDEYAYLRDLVRSVFSDGAWSGYIFNETLNTWGFIDGSSVPDGSWISGDLNNRDNGNPAHCARFYGNNLNDRGCGSRFPYVCSHPEWKPSLQFMQNIDSAKYQEILDNKCGSCINSLEAFKGLGHYVVWLQLSPWLGHFSAAVTFKTPVRCVDRQILNVRKKQSECTSEGYFKSCELVTVGNYHKYPSDVCEIEFQ